MTAELGPYAVRLVRTARGLHRRSAQVQESMLPPGGDPQDWQPAVATLDAALGAVVEPMRAALSVRLSSQFVRYCVLPWSDELRSEAEVEAFARHRLRETYGDVAQTWLVALASGWPGSPRMAAAIEPALSTAISDAAARAQLRIVSVQPQFTAYADSRRRSFKGDQFWLAESESGRIVLARARRGEWVSIVTARDGGDPVQALVSMLARESFAVDSKDACKRLYTRGLLAPQTAALAEAGWDIVPGEPHDVPLGVAA